MIFSSNCKITDENNLINLTVYHIIYDFIEYVVYTFIN